MLYNEKVPCDEPRAEEARHQWRDDLTEVRYTEDRIAIRLGVGHQVHLAFVECMKCLEQRRELAWAYERETDATEALKKEEESHSAYKAFRKSLSRRMARTLSATARGLRRRCDFLLAGRAPTSTAGSGRRIERFEALGQSSVSVQPSVTPGAH